MARLMPVRALLVALSLSLGLAGCMDDKPAKPQALVDPCRLISDEVLKRLAPGSKRESGGNVTSGQKSCMVDLTSGDGSMRGDLDIWIEIDTSDSYHDEWRAGRCASIGVKPTTSGPGDVSCLSVRAHDGSQARIDGYAWVGDDYEVRVDYQLIEPAEFPAGAEQDLRDLLAAAVDSLPVT